MTYRVPVALIRHICYPAGYRLPKLERLDYKWVKPTVPPPLETHRPSSLSLPVGVSDKGNLPYEEYRFYYGRVSLHSPHSNCRWCNLFFSHELARLAHVGPCKRALVDLYTILLKEGKCAVCLGRTCKSVWGIPLCGINCMAIWKFNGVKVFQDRVLERKKALL